MTLKAVTSTTTDQGIFEAVISTAAIDRERDIVEPAAMVDAVRAWIVTGKRIPLHWDHRGEPEDIIGYVDPRSVRTAGGEVAASGQVDLETDRGAEVWRLMKSDTLGFSFGYLVTRSFKRADGGRTITGLDVFEVSATPAPMNPGTRVLSWKSADIYEYDDGERDDDIASEDELRRRSEELGIVALDPLRREARDQMLTTLGVDTTSTTAEKSVEIERKSEAPIRIATFDA